MKTNKKLTPRNVAPVKRENVASVANDGVAIAPSYGLKAFPPFADDSAE